MKVEQKILNRFQSLISDGNALLKTRSYTREEVADKGEKASGRLDDCLAIKWELKMLTLFETIMW